MKHHTICKAKQTATIIPSLAFYFLVSLPGITFGQENGQAYLPLTFHAESGPLRTTACLEVTEFSPEEGFAGKTRAIIQVIQAFKDKNREALWSLADPRYGRNPKRFDRQAFAFFEQFEVLEFIGVRHAFAFDGLMLFIAELKHKDGQLFAPFLFSFSQDGSLAFLPYRTQALSYLLIKEWFDLSLRAGTARTPTYCSGSIVKRATHRFIVPAINDTAHPHHLILRGAPINQPGILVDATERVLETFKAMKAALSLDVDIDRFSDHMTLEGGNRLKAWFASATLEERAAYKRAIIEQQPFFVFDASPLIIVYTRGPNGIQVMYFTPAKSGGLVWTNSSHVTHVDKLFKSAYFRKAAALEPPFKGSEIQK